MKRLYVYADFDWLDAPEIVGELTCDAVRGSETYGFAFDKDWLKRHYGLFLSEDLQNFTGRQYTQPGNEIFSCFSDALPDRWGRTLLNRRAKMTMMLPYGNISVMSWLTKPESTQQRRG